MVTKDSIETAYSFLHQKRNVYVHSTMEWQRDDIEYAVASFVDEKSKELLEVISQGRSDFLKDHEKFDDDITLAVQQLEQLL